MVNTTIGEMGIHTEGRDYLFRPSLYALTKIGDPKELVSIYSKISYFNWGSLPYALGVMTACYQGEGDLFDLIGCYREGKKKSGKIPLLYRPGVVPVEDVFTLAFRLLKYGMVGKPKNNEGKEANSFDPCEFQAAAVAHFGLSPSEAWNLTMIEFQNIMNSKFPDKNDDIMSKKEYDALMKEHKEIMKRVA